MLYTILLFIIAFIAYKVLDWYLRLPVIEGIPSKYVLVTGCDSGFGNQVTKRLDKTGFNVIAACLTEKGMQDVQRETSNRVKTIMMDVTKDDSILAACDEVKEILPEGTGLWGLINNAGILGDFGMPDWLSRNDYRPVFEINTLGVIQVTMAFVPLIKKAEGRIVNVASIVGRISMKESLPYCISKYGVECFSDGIRLWLRPFNVSVHILEPGFFRTDLFQMSGLKDHMDRKWNSQTPEIKNEYGEEWYQDYVNRTIDGLKTKTNTNLSLVVSAMEHALTSVKPRQRYVCGLDAKLLFIPLSWLPAEIHDYIRVKLLQKGLPMKGAHPSRS